MVSSQIHSEHLIPTPKQFPSAETGTSPAALSLAAGSTATLNSATQSTLSGSTTVFYALRAITPNTTLYFTVGATQYVTNMFDVENISLRSTTDNSAWQFTYTGSSQTILNVDVKDSNAWSGSILLPDSASGDLGNNHNWAFGDLRYWVASVASGWNTTTSWSRASGGTSGASVPTSTHTVVFDGANGKDGQANVNLAVTISSLTVSGYTGLLNTQGYNITVSSSLTQTSGAITLTTNTVSVGGDFIYSPARFAFTVPDLRPSRFPVLRTKILIASERADHLQLERQQNRWRNGDTRLRADINWKFD